ncbi:nudix domain-containing protein [Dactylonectria macrodidyma]|uniref:Nudix domain-containing protein n=1 Tax=Dactylonectria macrodidyma TaxID=307937 RepID=A0A9P9D7I4_9HYPO|nr:nudix domain-containing protein [Dactylonectria macrodidyma]
MSALPSPQVGVAAIITNSEGRVLCSKRLNSHGSGAWQLPGGHLEYGESFLACAERKACEVTGLGVRGVKVVAVTNSIFRELGKHYIMIFVKCERMNKEAQPQVMEPDKCGGWFWKTWDELKEAKNGRDGNNELFLPLVRLFEEYPDIATLI